MAREEARHWEDYLPGSSDNPTPIEYDSWRPNIRYKLKIPLRSSLSLQEKLDHVQTVKKLKVDDPEHPVEVEATNEERVRFALKYRMRPVVRQNGRVFYRSAEFGEDGLLQISYGEFFRGVMHPITDEETMPLSHYEPEFRSELRELIRDGEIRGSSSRVNLGDVNRHYAQRNE